MINRNIISNLFILVKFCVVRSKPVGNTTYPQTQDVSRRLRSIVYNIIIYFMIIMEK